jgi:uncharacterized protein YqjF (DUF2071 family)
MLRKALGPRVDRRHTRTQRGVSMTNTDAPVAADQPPADSRDRPLFLADWRRVLFIHFAMDPQILAPIVPFPLDLYDGRAYVSLVAFTQARLRPAFGPRLARVLTAPLAEHAFLNVRTYVRGPRGSCREHERAVYFIAEWIPNRLAAFVGPRTYGLPYRLGRLAYDHAPEDGRLRGRVQAGDAALVYDASTAGTVDALAPAEPGSLTHFLIERYAAYTVRHRVRRRFAVRHAPWPHIDAVVDVMDQSLLAVAAPCLGRLGRPGAATYSPGVHDVVICAPSRLPDRS